MSPTKQADRLRRVIVEQAASSRHPVRLGDLYN